MFVLFFMSGEVTFWLSWYYTSLRNYVIICDRIYLLVSTNQRATTLLVPKHQAIELVHFFFKERSTYYINRFQLAYTILLGFLYICARCLWFELSLFYGSLHLLVGHQKLTEDGDCQEKRLLCGTVLWLLPSEPCMWPWYVPYLSCILINSVIKKKASFCS